LRVAPPSPTRRSSDLPSQRRVRRTGSPDCAPAQYNDQSRGAPTPEPCLAADTIRPRLAVNRELRCSKGIQLGRHAEYLPEFSQIDRKSTRLNSSHVKI